MAPIRLLAKIIRVGLVELMESRDAYRPTKNTSTHSPTSNSNAPTSIFEELRIADNGSVGGKFDSSREHRCEIRSELKRSLRNEMSGKVCGVE